MNRIIAFIFLLWTLNAYSEEKGILNIYIFGSYLPISVTTQFTKETGIRVNLIECESNESLITKIHSSPIFDGDLAVFSSFHIPKILNKLQQLNLNKLTNLKQIHPYFVTKDNNPSYPYNLPFCWGTTGLIVNKKYFNPEEIKAWENLWSPKFKKQIMVLNDSRELLGIALIALGYSINDVDPKHIEEAYNKLVALLPNIRLISLDGIPDVFVDEEINLGTVWSGDYYLAKDENPELSFILPQPKFVLWYDCFVLLKNAPHEDNAYEFLNFISRPDIAEQILDNGYFPVQKDILNKLFSKEVLADIFSKGQLQHSLPPETQKLYETYWNKLLLH